MGIASGQNTTLHIQEETSYGVAPSGNYTALGFASVSLALAKTNHESMVITGSREVQDVIMGSHSVTGDISFPLAHQDAYIEAISAVLGDTTASGGAFEVGNERNSYTLSVSHEQDISGNDDVHLFKGCEFNSFGLTIPADGLVECTFGVVGATMTTENSSSLGTPEAFNATDNPFHSSAVTITEGGSQSAIITDLTLNIDNGISTTNRIGSVTPIQGGISKCRVTGTLTAHFTSGVLYEKFVANTSSSLLISMGSGSTGLSFNMPNVVFTTGTVEVAGEGLLTVQMEFVATETTGGASTITFDSSIS